MALDKVIMSKNQEKGNIPDVKSYIVPWALSGENIPIHIEWAKNMRFDQIHIKIPDDFRFVDFLNVDKVNIIGSRATISKLIESTSPDAPLYFGFVISSTRIYDKLKIAKKVLVEFLYGDEIIKSLKLYARIFRPTLKVIDAIEKIELIGEQVKWKIPLHLKYIGFGDIRLKIEAKIGGRIVSQGESIIYELLRRAWAADIFSDKNIQKGKEEKKRDIRVEPTFIQEISEHLQKRIETGDLYDIFEMMGEEDVEDFKRWLSDVKTKDRFMEVIYSRIEDLLLDLLIDLLERHPTDNVRLASAQTKIKTKIELPIENINIRLKYTDLIENEYPPVEIPIKIEDKRVDKRNTVIEIPIIIEKWEEDPFMNVAEMEVLEER